MPHWTTPACNHLNGTDGSIFPPHITKNTTLNVYDKDLCRLLPLTFEKEVVTKDGVPGYRFTPSEKVFASVENNPDNVCFCPAGPPCAPHGMFNVSSCQYGKHRHKISDKYSIFALHSRPSKVMRVRRVDHRHNNLNEVPSYFFFFS